MVKDEMENFMILMDLNYLNNFHNHTHLWYKFYFYLVNQFLK